MPGIIAIKVYDLFHPPEKRDFGTAILEASAYGLINLGIWLLPLLSINEKGFIQNHPWWYAVLSFGFLVISPTAMAVLLVRLRNTKLVAHHIGYPTKTAWDSYFKKRRECWILFHLKSGKMVGGYFGPKSYVSAFPQSPEVYVEEVYRVGDDGKFIEKVLGTLGMVILLAEWERLEFLEMEEDENGK